MTDSALRVLLVCRSLPCHVPGGLEHHVVDLAAGLAALGAEVDLLSTPCAPDYVERLAARGVSLHEVPGVAPGRYSLSYFSRVGGRIEALHERRRYDVIHGQEFGFGFWRPAADCSAHLVLSVHGTITSETALHRDVFKELNPGAKIRAIARYGRRWLYAPTWLYWLRRSERILVDSEFTAREISPNDASIRPRVRQIHLGVDMERYSEFDRADARRRLGWSAENDRGVDLLTVGRLEWQKGHDLALNALTELSRTNPDLDWHYWIVGEGQASDDLDAMTRAKGLGDRVTFTGRIDAERKAEMLAAADLFVWPERTHPAFGLVGLEAMLMGTPVLGSTRGAIPELIDERSGWLFAGGDASQLQEKLGELLREPGLIAEKARGLRERTLARFSPGAMARETLEAYRELP